MAERIRKLSQLGLTPSFPIPFLTLHFSSVFVHKFIHFKIELVFAMFLNDQVTKILTRKLSYRKDDRAMRPIYGCPEKFRSRDLTATFPKICNGLLFRSILRMCVQNWKFVALPVPEIIGGTQKIWAVLGHAHAPFSPKCKCFMGLCSDGPPECIGQICNPCL